MRQHADQYQRQLPSAAWLFHHQQLYLLHPAIHITSEFLQQLQQMGTLENMDFLFV